MTTEAAADPALPSRRAGRECVALWIVAATFFVLLRAPLLEVPLERDEGEYAYIAQRMLAGDVPYRDAFDQKPPGTFFAYALAISLFGPSIAGLHAFAHAWTAATTLLLFACVRRRGGVLAASFAALVFAVASANPRLTGNAANTELFMLLPMVASVYCLLRALDAPGRLGWWIGCGALATLACWFKQVAVTNAVFVVAVASWHFGRPERRDLTALVRAGAGLALGALLASAPVLAGFALAGAWQPFVDAVFLHNLRYTQSVGLSQGLGMLAHRLGEQAPSFALLWLFAALAAGMPGRLGASQRGFWLGWWLAGAAGVSIGLYFRPHYFLQALPALAALAGLWLGALAERFGAGGRGAAWAGVAGLALAVVVPPVFATRGVLTAGDPARVSRAIYGLNPFPESLEIARHIERTSGPDDSVYIVGSEPQIFFYANRRSAARYIFFYPLTGDYPDVLERQRSVLDDVAGARPRYVVWVNLQSSLLRSDSTEPLVFDASRRLVEREYQLEFVAHPIPEDDRYEFVYGREARRLLRSAGQRVESAPWIGVYRRRD